jgi:hypothetical protein
MPRDGLLPLLNRIPQRARMALALGIGTRAAQAFRGEARIEALLDEALGLAWRWLGGEDIRADALNVYYERIVEIEMDEPEGSHAKNVLTAAGIAFGYLNAHAYEVDLKRGLIAAADFPGSMCEYGEERVEEVCEYAARVLGPAFDALYERLVANISARVADYSAQYPTQLSAQDMGPPFSRQQVEEGA